MACLWCVVVWVGGVLCAYAGVMVSSPVFFFLPSQLEAHCVGVFFGLAVGAVSRLDTKQAFSLLMYSISQ